MTEREPTLDDALFLLEAHRRTGCLWYATDYAERTRGIDRDRLRLGIQYVINGLTKAEQKRKAES